MTAKKLALTNVNHVSFNWLRSNDAKASITSTAIAVCDLPKPLTNCVNEVLSTSFTTCRNGVFEIQSLMQLLLLRQALFAIRLYYL